MQPIFILTPETPSVGVVPEIELSQGMVVRVGRIASNDYAVPEDLLISSVHFEAHGEVGGCRIVDLESSNGLFVNEERVSQALAIEGDRIRAGNTIWTVARRGGNEAQTAEVWSPTAAIPDQPEFFLDETPANVAPGLGQVDRSYPSLLLTSETGETRSLEQGGRLTIGRTDRAQWIFGQDAQMSSLHFEVFDRDGSWWAKDLQSTNGLYVNEGIVNEQKLADGDEIRSGQMTFRVEVFRTNAEFEQSGVPFDFRSQALRSTSSNIETPAPTAPRSAPQFVTTACLRRVADGHEFQLPRDRSVLLGRSLNADISLHSDAQVSTEHASLLFDGQVINVTDLGSSNGSYLGDQRIRSGQIVQGDRIRFGQTDFEVQIRDPLCAEDATIERQSSAESDNQASTIDTPLHGVAQAQASDAHLLDLDGTSAVDVTSETPISSEQSPAAKNVADDFETAGPPENADEIPYFTEEDFKSQATKFNSEANAQTSKAGGHERAERVSEKPVELLQEDKSATGRQSVMPGEYFAEGRDETGAKVEDADQGITVAAPLPRHQQVAGNSIDYQRFKCGSGLVLYRGVSPKFDPLDVALRLLEATQGWVLDGAQVERWLQNYRSGAEQTNDEWMQPASANDASWMLPFSDSWGCNRAWLIYTRGEVESLKKAIINLQVRQDGSQEFGKALRPKAISEFLANHCGGTIVERFFAPLDAILLEVHGGERWALFGRAELEPCLQDLNFVPRPQW